MSQLNIKIPRTMDDNAGYFLLSVRCENGLIETIHKRESSESVGFSKTLINCSKMMYKDIGYGEGSIKNLKDYETPSDWTSVIMGSSKSDLVNFICLNYRG